MFLSEKIEVAEVLESLAL